MLHGLQRGNIRKYHSFDLIFLISCVWTSSLSFSSKSLASTGLVVSFLGKLYLWNINLVGNWDVEPSATVDGEDVFNSIPEDTNVEEELIENILVSC